MKRGVLYGSLCSKAPDGLAVMLWIISFLASAAFVCFLNWVLAGELMNEAAGL